jgi:hypothetical protein
MSRRATYVPSTADSHMPDFAPSSIGGRDRALLTVGERCQGGAQRKCCQGKALPTEAIWRCLLANLEDDNDNRQRDYLKFLWETPNEGVIRFLRGARWIGCAFYIYPSKLRLGSSWERRSSRRVRYSAVGL